MLMSLQKKDYISYQKHPQKLIASKSVQDSLIPAYSVHITEIKGLLQDNLERLFKKYVKKETGQDLAYDPKKIKKEEFGKLYYQVLNWGRLHTPHLLKSGWSSLKNL
jgi:hypothetical protein